jgi:hypothetical protein
MANVVAPRSEANDESIENGTSTWTEGQSPGH